MYYGYLKCARSARKFGFTKYQITDKIPWFFQVDFFKFHDFSRSGKSFFSHFSGVHDFSRGWKPWLLLIPVMLGLGPLEVCGLAASIAERDRPGNFIFSDTVPPSPLPPRLKSNKFTLSEPCHAKFPFRTPAFAIPCRGANYEKILLSLWKCVAEVWKKSTCPPLFLPVPDCATYISTSENRQNFNVSFRKVPTIFTCPQLFLPFRGRGTIIYFHR